MKLSRDQIVAFGVGVALTFSADSVGDEIRETRPAYPAGLVCAIPLEAGSSPKALADSSLFAADAETVIQRSQFVNPEAVLAYDRGDDRHFPAQSLFNVMLRERHIKRPTNRPYFDADYRARERIPGSCVINSQWSKLVSDFPDIETAAKILKSTVAVIEKDKRNEVPAFRRCGAIAVGKNLLLPSREYVDAKHACADLRSAETENKPLIIAKDTNEGPWRFLETDTVFPEPVEIDDNYFPRYGDTLLYSGYNKFGGRQYFRVVVAGHHEGRVLLRAGLDQLYTQAGEEQNGIRLLGGTGGFFTMEGKLVAISEQTEETSNGEPYSYYTPEYNNYLLEHDKWLTAETEKYGFNIMYDEPREQYVFALRVSSDSLAKAQEQVKP